MIVQCELCSTKFKLDDAKVKDEGVKVRCSKCRHLFIVRKERQEAQDEKDFDSLLNGLVTGSQQVSETSEQEGTFSDEKTDVTIAQGTSDEAIETTGPGFGPFEEAPASPFEVQVPDTDMFAGEGFVTETSQAAGDVDWFSQAGDEKPESFDMTQKLDEGEFDFNSSLPGKEEEGESPFATNETISEGRVTDMVAVDWGGEIKEPVSPESETGEEKPVAEKFAGISWDIPDTVTPAKFETEVDHQEQTVNAVGMNAVEIPTVPPPATELSDISADEPVPLSIPSRRRSASPLSIAVVAISAVSIIALAVAGLFMLKSGPASFEKFGIGELTRWIGLGKGEEGGISIRGTTGEFLVNKECGELFVVKGEVVNAYSKPRASIQLRAFLYGSNGVVLSSRNFYCGNSLTREQLMTLPLAKLEAAMANQFGDSLSNLGVKPGGTIPFVVVFPKVPKEAVDFGLEVAGSTAAGR